MKFKQNKKRNTRKYLLLLSAGLFLIGTVFLAIEGVASGVYVSSLERQEASLVEQNRELSGKILEVSSLSGIEKKAGELGFAKPQEVVYIGREESIAKVP